MYLVSPGPLISLVHGGMSGCCGSQADLPDGIHSICGMTFCSTGTQGHRVTVQTAGKVLRCVQPPWDTAAEWDAHHSVALQMLLTTARLSASLGLDQIHREECSLRLSLQPPRDAGARTHTDTHTNTRTQADTVTFGIISKRSQFHQWKAVMARDFSFFRFVFWICAWKER